MADEQPDDLDDIGREIRSNELKEDARELAGGEMVSWESDQCAPGLTESFWQRVVDYEKAPLTSHFQLLLDRGVDLPEAEAMTDEVLTAKLWEVIHRLAGMRVFLSGTDHLSDRELYTHLWSESLREPIADLPFDENSSYHIDILGGCSEEDIQLRMKYYADEAERRRWQAHWPDDPMPPHEDPPFDRDRHLPKSGF